MLALPYIGEEAVTIWTADFGGQRSAILLFLLKQLYHRKLAERLAYRMSDMNLVIVFDA